MIFKRGESAAREVRIQRIVASAGFLVLGLVLAGGVMAQSVPARGGAISDLNLEFLKKKENARNWGRDPFELPETKKGESGGGFGLQLSAIIFREGSAVAIINSEIVRKGDEINGFSVVEIYQDHVLLKNASGTQDLRVHRFIMGSKD